MWMDPKALNRRSRQLGRDRTISNPDLHFGAKIVALEVNLQRAFDIWLSYHPDSSRIPRSGASSTGLSRLLTLQDFRGLKTNSAIQTTLKQYIRGNPR